MALPIVINPELRGSVALNLSSDGAPGRTQGLARPPKHRSNEWRSTYPDLLDHLETVAQIERDVPRIGRLEVG